MFLYVLTEKHISLKEVDVLSEILSSYGKSLRIRNQILESNNISNNDKINKHNTELEIFSNKFSIKETEFYSLIDSEEEKFKNSISTTYDLLKEID